MFKKKEEKISTNKAGNTTVTTHQTSSEIRQRSIVTNYVCSSVSQTRTNGQATVTSRQIRTIGDRPSIFELPSTGNLWSSTGNDLFSIPSSGTRAITDKPLVIDGSSSHRNSYQSPFSRKLTPYALDAKPFNVTSQPVPSKKNTSLQPVTPSSNTRRQVSYNPERTQLNHAPSTQSLPTTAESIVSNPIVPTYHTQGKKRGKVLILNNVKFLQEKENRKGAEVDERNLKSLFKDMGFEVEVYRDLKKSGMQEKINRFSRDGNLKKVDISIVIMMSHGSNIDEKGRVIQGGFTQIYGIDNEGLAINDVLDTFSGEKCTAMAGKPKIFIFQCCRGEGSEMSLKLRCDAVPMQSNIVKKHADMLIAFSTLPGFFSIRDTQEGSWYIQCIYDVFKRHAKEFDVETLLKIVDDQLSKKHPNYQQTSTYESRGFKRCFLNPKY